MSAYQEFCIRFHPLNVPAFQGEKGLWTNYEAVTEAGITSLTVTPVLKEIWVEPDLICTDIDLYFDEEKFPRKRFNIVYGDRQFEEEIIKLFAKAFPPDVFGEPFYREAGMQGEDYVAMEYTSEFAGILRRQSAHFRMELLQRPEIESVIIPSNKS